MIEDIREHKSVESQVSRKIENESSGKRLNNEFQKSKDSILSHIQTEIEKYRIEKKPVATLENKINSLEKTKKVEIEKQRLEGICDIQKMEPRFHSMNQINEYKQEAWQKLKNSREGSILIKEAGGINNVKNMMEERTFNFLTRSATLCEKAGLSDDATGRNIHKLAELSTLEKHPDDVLSGRRQVEQRIIYHDQNDTSHHIELDDVTRLRDGRVYLRDFKPVNLSNFERTQGGQAWACWCEKNIGPDFREQIQSGKGPFFNENRQNPMPKSVRSELQSYLKKVTEHHNSQLEKYKSLLSAADGVDQKNVKTAIIPYYKFS